MEFIATNVRVPMQLSKVLEAITTAAGHRGWWCDDCEVGRAVGDEAVYRFDSIEVVFRIDRLDARGMEMTCIRNKDCPDWQGTKLTLRAVEEGKGSHVDLLHDGWPARTPFYEACVGGWEKHLKSLPDYCLTGRGAPYISRRN